MVRAKILKMEWYSPRTGKISDQFSVRRILPYRGGRGVGPFVFLDHMGPLAIEPSTDTDVKPHPHIGLSTLTYLFDGELDHRDSLGYHQRICPFDVNWMTAGQGIVHSERTPEDLRNQKRNLHGLQAWVALPSEKEEMAPNFSHHPQSSIPTVTQNGCFIRMILGEGFGIQSPVKTENWVFYAHITMEKQSQFCFPKRTEMNEECAFYLVDGTIEVKGRTYQENGLLVFDTDEDWEITSPNGCTGLFLGGEKLQEHRTIWWNFVSTNKQRIEAAKARWQAQKFPPVPGETEFVPLPK